MKLKNFLSLAVVSSLMAFSYGPSALAATTVKLRMASPYPATIPQSELETWWIGQIAKDSAGGIEIKPFWSGEAGAHEEIPDLVGSGAIDIGAAVQGSFPSKFALFGVPNTLPLSFKTIEQASAVQTKILDVPAVQAELKKDNIQPLWQHVLNPYRLLCTKPVNSLDDFKGLRIRSYGIYQPIMWKALGATPVNVQAVEVYEGLQRGRIDCAYFSEDLFVQWRLYEVAKYVSGADFGPMSGWSVFMNKDKYDSLSDNDRAIINKVSAQASQRELDLMHAQAKDAVITLKQKGVEYTDFTDQAKLEEIVPNFIYLWAKNEVEKGTPADDVQQIVTIWRAELDN